MQESIWDKDNAQFFCSLLKSDRGRNRTLTIRAEI